MHLSNKLPRRPLSPISFPTRTPPPLITGDGYNRATPAAVVALCWPRRCQDGERRQHEEEDGALGLWRW
ncbi:hypothetical protein Hdeb2414_s0005g00162001 [Helianthus debilis subsp. tardiflorus]